MLSHVSRGEQVHPISQSFPSRYGTRLESYRDFARLCCSVNSRCRPISDVSSKLTLFALQFPLAWGYESFGGKPTILLRPFLSPIALDYQTFESTVALLINIVA